jgi:hypothetical protein
MSAHHAVKEFIRHAHELLNVLRREGRDLSEIDLHMLTAQLHLLEIESTNLQTFKKLQSSNRAA